MTPSIEPPAVLRFVTLHRCVSHLQRSIAFYCDALGFEVVANAGNSAVEAVLTLGTESIVLTERIASESSWPYPASGPNVRFQHVAIVTNDMDAAFRRLQGHESGAISRGGPQRLPAASGGVRAFKFRDPDAHPLELIEFPPAKGASRWHTTSVTAGPTLGIDHCAISVADIDISISFYRELGFRLGARQSNHGDEQARLDGLAVAKVDVAALFPVEADSPHLELLGYVAPKPFHDEVKPWEMADVMSWHRHERDSAAAQSREGSRVLRADPDGHLMELT